MNAPEAWLISYVLNSLWEIPLIFAAAWLCTRMMRRSGPQVEHSVWLGALLLEVLLPACQIRANGLLREMRMVALLWRRWGAGGSAGDMRIGVSTGTSSVHVSPVILPEWALAVLAVIYGAA